MKCPRCEDRKIFYKDKLPKKAISTHCGLCLGGRVQLNNEMVNAYIFGRADRRELKWGELAVSVRERYGKYKKAKRKKI